MTYAERGEEAQQEQLDWLHQIHAESQTQTELLARIARHTALLYGATVVALVLAAVWLLAQLYDVIHA